MRTHRSHLAFLAATFLGLCPLAGQAQQSGPGWFVPNAPAPGRPAAPRMPRAGAPMPGAVPVPAPDMQAGGEEQQPMPQVPLPPVPELPPLPRGSAPPAAVIGVLGVPEVMRASTAAQQVEKAIGERRDKLNQDAQREQTAWRDMQQALAADRAKLSPDQVRARERELQERITGAQKQFRDRNRVIQEAAQYALGQIERTLIGVIRQVSESRGMNLVLHRAQVALNVNEFDITQQVADQLNKVQPSVMIPPDGMPITTFVAQQKAQGQPEAQKSAAGQGAPQAPARAGQAAH